MRANAKTASEFEEANRQEERARDALIEAEERARAAAKAAEDASVARVHALALNEPLGIGVKGTVREEHLEATRVAADTAEKEAARAKAAVEAARVDVNALP